MLKAELQLYEDEQSCALALFKRAASQAKLWLYYDGPRRSRAVVCSRSLLDEQSCALALFQREAIQAKPWLYYDGHRRRFGAKDT